MELVVAEVEWYLCDHLEVHGVADLTLTD
jgi:hypothetical protein